MRNADPIHYRKHFQPNYHQKSNILDDKKLFDGLQEKLFLS